MNLVSVPCIFASVFLVHAKSNLRFRCACLLVKLSLLISSWWLPWYACVLGAPSNAKNKGLSRSYRWKACCTSTRRSASPMLLSTHLGLNICGNLPTIALANNHSAHRYGYNTMTTSSCKQQETTEAKYINNQSCQPGYLFNHDWPIIIRWFGSRIIGSSWGSLLVCYLGLWVQNPSKARKPTWKITSGENTRHIHMVVLFCILD
jgi:hypothetical protein